MCPLAQSLQLAMGSLKIIQEIPYSREVNLSFFQSASSVPKLSHSWRSMFQTALDLLEEVKRNVPFCPGLQDTSVCSWINCEAEVRSCHPITENLPAVTHLAQVLTLVYTLDNWPSFPSDFIYCHSPDVLLQSHQHPQANSCLRALTLTPCSAFTQTSVSLPTSFPNFLKAFNDIVLSLWTSLLKAFTDIVLSLWTSLLPHSFPLPSFVSP